MLEFISFYLFSVLVIACFVVVVFSSNVLYALSALASGMILIAGIFFNLGADFLGVVQISVYTGAVMALYAFGMMFFDSAKKTSERHASAIIIGILSVGVAIMLVLIVSLPRILVITADYEAPEGLVGNVENVGIALFTKYLLPFEIAALMLLVALIAGIVLAMKKNPNLESGALITQDSSANRESSALIAQNSSPNLMQENLIKEKA